MMARFIWYARWIAMAAKELRVVLLDKRARTTLIISPIVQLLLYGMASTLEVKNVDVGVVNRDNGIASQEILSGLAGSGNIRTIRYYPSIASMSEGIKQREVLVGMSLPSDLSRDIAAGRTAMVGLVVDGRKINAGQIVAEYMDRITRRAGADLRPAYARDGPRLVAVNWYNPNLDYRWFTMPALIAVVCSVLVISVSVHTFAREREAGTIDTLQMLPMTAGQKLLGKIMPAFLVGLFNATLFVMIIPLVFGVPLLGSLALLFVAVVAFSLALAGVGTAISTVSQTQQQAFLIGFMVITPLTLLAGFATPIDNMPEWLQSVAWLNPLRHMLEVSHGVFLKDLPVRFALENIVMMLAFAGFFLTIAYVNVWRRFD